MAANGQVGIIHAPRRAAGIRIVLGILRTNNSPPPYPEANGHIFRSSCGPDEGQTPTFVMNGVLCNNPGDALRAAGHGAGLYPETDERCSRDDIDLIVTSTDDFLAYYMAAVADPTNAGLLDNLNNKHYPELLNLVAEKASENVLSHFCVGDRLTIANAQMYAVFAIVDGIHLEGFNIIPTTTKVTSHVYNMCRGMTTHAECALLPYGNAHCQTHPVGL